MCEAKKYLLRKATTTPGDEHIITKVLHPRVSMTTQARNEVVRLPSVANIVSNTVYLPRTLVGTNSIKREKSTARLPPRPKPMRKRQRTRV